MLTEAEAENYIYQSYLKAEKQLRFADKDALKRHPEYSKAVLQKLSITPAVTVTGSKGKGSVSSMISEILQTKYNVGLMTSPHIKNFRERFRINGRPILADDFAACVTSVKSEFAQIEQSLSPAEYISPIGIQAAVALTYFNRNHTQFNVIEHGKGAQYDDVSNITHRYAVINSVFLEHTRELGQTLEEIAFDKVHTITDDVRIAVVAEQKPEVTEVIRRYVAQKKCQLLEYGRDFAAENITFTPTGMQFAVKTANNYYSAIKIPLLGVHQAQNCALAMALCEQILPDMNIAEVRKRLAVMSWPGRQEIICAKPFIMLDACINRASATAVKATLNQLHITKVTTVIGIPDDKDFAGVAEVMAAVSARIILTKSSNPHYIFTAKQSADLRQKGIATTSTESLPAALSIARQDDLPVVILGTTSLISDAENIFS